MNNQNRHYETKIGSNKRSYGFTDKLYREWVLRLAKKLWCGQWWYGKLALTYLRARVLSWVGEIAHQTHLKRMVLPPTDRKPQIIVSLTAIPSRLKMLDLVIKSILWQTTPPDRIILWLSETHRREELGNLSPSNLPAKLLALEKRGVLEICWTKDIGPYCKLLPSLQRFPDDIIITIDDDIFYDKNVIETLYNAYLEHGEGYVYSRRSRLLKKEGGKIRFGAKNWSADNNDKMMFAAGFGGILYPPHIFSDEVFNEAIFQKFVPYEDDCWFYVMARLNGRRVFQVNSREPLQLPSEKSQSLLSLTNATGGKRKLFIEKMTKLMRHYSIDE